MYQCETSVQVFTLFGQRVGNVEVIIVEVQELHCSVQSELSLVYLLRYGIHRDLAQQRSVSQMINF